MSDKRTRLESILHQAVKAKLDLENERNDKIANMKREINQKYRIHITKREIAITRAQKNLFNHIDKAVRHPREGEIVVRKRKVYHRFSARIQRVDKIYGVVETVKSDCKMPSNLSSYSRPNVGDVIIRSIKKDGSPGIKFHNYYNEGSQNYRDLPGWEIAPNGVE